MGILARNRNGNVLLQVLAATAVMSISFYFLTTYVIGQKQQVGKTVNMVNLRFTLNSAMDYVIFGIRQKYCFTNDNLLLNEVSASACNLAHTGSVERIIMSEDQEQFIQAMIENKVNVGTVDKNNIRLKKITRYMKATSASAAHPLFPVLESLRAVRDEDGKVLPVDGLSVEISRNESPFLPKVGREAYLTVKVSMKTSENSAALRVGSNDMTVTSHVVIYPREVGSFALVVPNDLYLDKSFQDTVGAGDVMLHRFGSRSEAAGAQGLIFQSPVFVNKNIHIPNDDGRADESTLAYSAVTFADRVYLGNGTIMANGKDFQPRHSGATGNRYWADLRSFGGFLRGVENDGGLDQGLLYFAKILQGAAPSTAEMENCKKLDQAKTDTKKLADSGVQDSRIEATSGRSKYRISLSGYNQFSEQNIKRRILDTGDWRGKSANMSKADEFRVIMKVSLELGPNNIVEAEMKRGAELKAVANVGSAALKASYDSAVGKAKQNLQDAKAEEDNVRARRQLISNEISSARSYLNAELSKPKKPEESANSSGGSGSGSGSSSGSNSSSQTSSGEDDERSPSSESGSNSNSNSGSSGSGSNTPKVDYQDPSVVANWQSKINQLQATLSEYDNNRIPAQERNVGSMRTAVTQAEYAQSEYNNLVNNPPEFSIQVEPVYNSFWGKTYLSSYKADLNVSYKNMKSLIDADGKRSIKPRVKVLAYDSSYYQGNAIYHKNNKLAGEFIYEINASGDLVPPGSFAGAGSANDPDDPDSIEARCEDMKNAASSQAFGNAGWDVSFAVGTRSSWNFAAGEADKDSTKDPVLSTYEFTAGSDSKFDVRSIVGHCIIQEDANFVTGFYTCDRLTIQARTKPLRIVGTFIVSAMSIDPSAYKAGITWSSIYHPQATRELRQREILESATGRDCDAPAADPIWHPVPSVKEVADVRSCNAISLRAKADPFQWTAVDPDCGLLNSNATNTTCKKRLVRFFVVEQSREGGM